MNLTDIRNTLEQVKTIITKNAEPDSNKKYSIFKVLVSGNTLQLKDYSQTDWAWTMFNPEAKQKRHDTIFPKECQKAYEA